jgi:hypothetical protein
MVCPDSPDSPHSRSALWHSCLDERPVGARPGTAVLSVVTGSVVRDELESAVFDTRRQRDHGGRSRPREGDRRGPRTD